LAAAEVGGCTEILSEDFSDNALYAGIRIRNPFRGLE
jgi:predicted nucleic acid-binding protein